MEDEYLKRPPYLEEGMAAEERAFEFFPDQPSEAAEMASTLKAHACDVVVDVLESVREELVHLVERPSGRAGAADLREAVSEALERRRREVQKGRPE